MNSCELAAAPTNSLHFLLHAAEVAGAKQHGAAASGEIDPVPILGKQMLPSKSRNLLDEEGTCRPVSLGAVEGVAGTAAMKSCAGCQAHATPSKDKDAGLEQNHLIGGYSCESSSQGGFPPLHIWKKRRLRACRVVESDIQSGEGQWSTIRTFEPCVLPSVVPSVMFISLIFFSWFDDNSNVTQTLMGCRASPTQQSCCSE
jgi:hypothetical protein